MKQIIIEADHKGVSVYPADETDDISDDEVLELLLNAYVSVASDIIHSHNCEDRDCHLRLTTTNIISAIRSTMKAHNVKYHL